jgi:hypothetical protein
VPRSSPSSIASSTERDPAYDQLDRAHRLPAPVRSGHLDGFHRRALAQGRPRPAARVGPRRPPLRHRGDLVPDRRRPLHRLHLHRGARTAVRRRCDRLLRHTVHDHGLSDPVHRVPAPLVGGPQTRLHHLGRLRARTLRQPLARSGNSAHRHPGDHAVHRAATGRHSGRTRRHGNRDHRPQWRSSADHRLRRPGGLHLHVRVTRTGDDRHRQGRADLRHRDRRGHRGTAPSRRLRQGVLADPHRPPARSAASAPTPRSRSARLWRCSSTRTRSRGS